MSDDWRDALRGLIPADTPMEEPDPVPAQDSLPRCPQLRVSVERKGRAGKTATIIYGFPDDFPEEEISALASRLRHRLGTGGSARGGEILLQGDRGAATVEALLSFGYRSRLC